MKCHENPAVERKEKLHKLAGAKLCVNNYEIIKNDLFCCGAELFYSSSCGRERNRSKKNVSCLFSKRLSRLLPQRIKMILQGRYSEARGIVSGGRVMISSVARGHDFQEGGGGW